MAEIQYILTSTKAGAKLWMPYASGGDVSHTHAWGTITGKPTTLAGYGITKTAIPFTSATPVVSDYQTAYSVKYGQYPDVKCIIMIDANNGYQLQQMPQFTYVDGLIDTIYYDLAEELTGFIVLS